MCSSDLGDAGQRDGSQMLMREDRGAQGHHERRRTPGDWIDLAEFPVAIGPHQEQAIDDLHDRRGGLRCDTDAVKLSDPNRCPNLAPAHRPGLPDR